MKEFIYKMKNPAGFHARPASQIFMAAAGFGSRIEAAVRERTANCKELLSIMSLPAGKGEEVTFRFDGSDEAEAETALRSVLDRL